jgi:hypothetical protein
MSKEKGTGLRWAIGHADLQLEAGVTVLLVIGHRIAH